MICKPVPSEADEFQGKSGAGMYGDFALMGEAQMAEGTLVIFTFDTGPVWYGASVVTVQR